MTEDDRGTLVYVVRRRLFALMVAILLRLHRRNRMTDAEVRERMT